MKKFKLLLFFTFFSFLFTFFYFNVSEEFIYTKNIETVSTGQNREIMVYNINYTRKELNAKNVFNINPRTTTVANQTTILLECVLASLCCVKPEPEP